MRDPREHVQELSDCPPPTPCAALVHLLETPVQPDPIAAALRMFPESLGAHSKFNQIMADH